MPSWSSARGSLGTVVAAALAASGVDVVVDCRPAHVAAIEDEGLVVGGLRDCRARARATAGATAIGAVDYLLLAVKNGASTPVALGGAGRRAARGGGVAAEWPGQGRPQPAAAATAARAYWARRRSSSAMAQGPWPCATLDAARHHLPRLRRSRRPADAPRPGPRRRLRGPLACPRGGGQRAHCRVVEALPDRAGPLPSPPSLACPTISSARRPPWPSWSSTDPTSAPPSRTPPCCAGRLRGIQPAHPRYRAARRGGGVAVRARHDDGGQFGLTEMRI